MQALKTILVPLDFSERSRLAAAQAVELAKHFESNLIFAHVVVPVEPSYANFEEGAYIDRSLPTTEELVAGAERQMDAFIAGVKSDRPIAKLVLKGDPATEIVDQTHKMDVGMIVMPTHGYGRFRRFVLGSVTTKVLHDANCPVLTGTHISAEPAFQEGLFKRVACAVDLQEGSEAVVRWAAEFAKSYGAELTVIHAAPEIYIGGMYGEWLPPETHKMVRDAAKERVETLIRDLGVDARVEVDCGQPAIVIGEKLATKPADVLVIGRSTKTGLVGRLRTHAYALIRESPVPVISV